MILSLMTYARVDSFRYFLGMEAQFERYMSTVERSSINADAANMYITTRAKTKSDNENEKPKPPPTPPSAPRISFRIFVDEKMRQEHPQEYNQTKEWAKSLMTTLYGNQAFFKEAEAKNSFFMDQIIEALGKTAQELPEDRSLKDTMDLSNLDLGPDLEKTFYLMLKGCLKDDDNADKAKPSVPEREFSVTLPDNKESDDGDEDEDAEEAMEYTGGKGYDSLLNYITLRNTTRIRIYLASKPVLQAIFKDALVVDQLIETRTKLYREVMNGSMSAAEATEQLKATVHGHLGNSDDSYFEYKVSKTNPSQYD
jgi:hypothetical protein